MVEFFCENRFLVHYSFLPLTFLLRGKADFWKIQCPGGDDKNLGEIFAWGTWVKISRFNLLKTMKYGNMRVCISLTLGKKCPNTEFFLVLIFPHSDWIRWDTLYLSAFSPNAGKYGPEKTPYLDNFHAVWG